MQICPNCANELGDLDIICASCGHVVGVRGPAPASWSGVVEDPRAAAVVAAHVAAADAEVTPDVTAGDLDGFAHVETDDAEGVPVVAAAAPHAVPRDAAVRPVTTSRNTIFVAAAIGAVAAVVFIVRSSRSNAQTSSPDGAASKVAAPAAAATSPVQATSRNMAARPTAGLAPQSGATTEPKWNRTRQLQWTSDGSRIIGFELPAERDVSVYMDRVRPVLAVRCTSRQTEVFVLLHTAASIESGRDTHAVRIGLDDQPDVEERWLDSSDMQALFAPDAKMLAARMATARRLRFGFKPFNAAPAVVEFDVHGFDGPLAAMSKVCASGAKRGPSPRG